MFFKRRPTLESQPLALRPTKILRSLESNQNLFFSIQVKFHKNSINSSKVTGKFIELFNTRFFFKGDQFKEPTISFFNLLGF